MFRASSAVTLAVVLLAAVAALAQESKANVISATLKSFDPQQHKLTVGRDGREYTYKLTSDTKVLTTDGQELKERDEALLRYVKAQSPARLTLEKQDGKDVLTQIRMVPRTDP